MLKILTSKNEEIRLKLKAERDTLTGLYNKGTTEKLINDFLNSEEASLGMHAFLIVDIDNFKSVNDNLGHVFGDKVLFEVSKNLKPIFRKDDIVGRIGGDEFIVFLKIFSLLRISKESRKICDIFRNSYTENKRHIKYLEQLEFHLYQNMELYLKNFIKSRHSTLLCKEQRKR